MIASNFGQSNVVYELLRRGSLLEQYDSFKFDAMLYAWKGKHYHIVLYFMCFQ